MVIWFCSVPHAEEQNLCLIVAAEFSTNQNPDTLFSRPLFKVEPFYDVPSVCRHLFVVVVFNAYIVSKRYVVEGLRLYRSIGQ